MTTCAACRRVGRIHARGICGRCYSRALYHRRLSSYPLPERAPRQPEQPKRVEASNWPDCCCAFPIVQPIPLFHTVQCARCGKRLALPPNDGSRGTP